MNPAETDAPQTELDAGKIITFPQGIPGFETYTKYTIFHKQENQSSAYWLESVDSPQVSFTLIDPTAYGLNYSMDLSDEEQQLLGADNPEDLAVLLMLSRKEDAGNLISSLHANIAGPVIINLKKRLGIQKVLVSAKMDVNIIQDE